MVNRVVPVFSPRHSRIASIPTEPHLYVEHSATIKMFLGHYRLKTLAGRRMSLSTSGLDACTGFIN